MTVMQEELWEDHDGTTLEDEIQMSIDAGRFTEAQANAYRRQVMARRDAHFARRGLRAPENLVDLVQQNIAAPEIQENAPTSAVQEHAQVPEIQEHAAAPGTHEEVSSREIHEHASTSETQLQQAPMRKSSNLDFCMEVIKANKLERIFDTIFLSEDFHFYPIGNQKIGMCTLHTSKLYLGEKDRKSYYAYLKLYKRKGASVVLAEEADSSLKVKNVHEIHPDALRYPFDLFVDGNKVKKTGHKSEQMRILVLMFFLWAKELQTVFGGDKDLKKIILSISETIGNSYVDPSGKKPVTFPGVKRLKPGPAKKSRQMFRAAKTSIEERECEDGTAHEDTPEVRNHQGAEPGKSPEKRDFGRLPGSMEPGYSQGLELATPSIQDLEDDLNDALSSINGLELTHANVSIQNKRKPDQVHDPDYYIRKEKRFKVLKKKVAIAEKRYKAAYEQSLMALPKDELVARLLNRWDEDEGDEAANNGDETVRGNDE